MIARTIILAAVALLFCSCQSGTKESQFKKGWTVESYGAGTR